MKVQTQWVIAGMGDIVGLNYQSVEFLLKIYKIKDKREMIEQLQEIERGVMAALVEQKKKKRVSP